MMTSPVEIQQAGFWGLLLMLVVSSIITILLRPKIEADDKPVDFRPPEPREGEPINIIFGTVKVSPMIGWFGDVHGRHVVSKEGGFLGFFQQDVPLGKEYLAGMQLVLCHGPIDKLLDIHIGEYHIVRKAQPRAEGVSSEIDPQTPYKNTNPVLPVDFPVGGQPTVVYLNMPDLFGGAKEGGGIVGQLDIHWGTESQPMNPYLALWIGPDILPQYRGIAYIVLRRMNMGKSPSPLPWHFVCERISKVLGADSNSTIVDADGNNTANAAECVYELLTNTRWGVGMHPDEIDIDTFQAVAATLFTEGLGYNGQLPVRQSAYSSIRTILEHVDGILYQDPVTGLIGILLIRKDYSVSSLPQFDEQNSVLEVFTRGSWGEVINETSVKYIDIKRRFSDATAQAQNLASIQAMRDIISTQISLPGLSTHELAQDAADRDNRTSSVPIVRGRISTNRFGYNLHQGSPFRIVFPHHGITETACRVTSINYGSLLEGRMEIEFVQDPFDHHNPYGDPSAFVDNVFCGPLSLLIVGYNPADDPGASYGGGEIDVFEQPYWHAGANRRAFTVVSRRSNQDVYWLPYRAEHGEPYVQLNLPQAFHAHALLDAALPKTSPQTGLTLVVQNFGDCEKLTSSDAAGRVAGERLAILDNGVLTEIIAWETVVDNGDGTFDITGVMRGVLDTVPIELFEGARVTFYWNESGAPSAVDLSTVNYDDFTDFAIRAARVSLDGEEQEFEASAGSNVLLHDRAIAPYPPGKVTLNSNEYPAWPAATTGHVTPGWTHRSRTEQTTIIAQDDATSHTLQGTITVEVLIDGAVVRTFASLTGTSQVYTFAQRTSDDADVTKAVVFRITPVGTGSDIGYIRETPKTVMSA